ncbi:TetR/AcrR family transcriptional regulator [Psychromicrobium sp. YIM B11713]|uniref:TetR/AcrR family transcriptional regulator n=1 Tax=Psychromicrobium sp. YIM B11713 TaxID=3145233 RepID=UPI00374E62DC
MSEASPERPRRADATRNIDSLISAAQSCFRHYGPDISLQTIASAAGVGVATLFRNFTDKDVLISAVLSRQVELRVKPLLRRALNDSNPGRGLIYVSYGILGIASREANMMTAIRSRQDTLAGMAIPVVDSLFELLRKAQAQGSVRPDLGLEDEQSILSMLLGAVETTPSGTPAWKRFAELLGDAIFIPVQQRALHHEPQMTRNPEVWGPESQARVR